MKNKIIAVLALISLFLVGCSALLSVGDSNTNTINQTNNLK